MVKIFLEFSDFAFWIPARLAEAVARRLYLVKREAYLVKRISYCGVGRENGLTVER